MARERALVTPRLLMRRWRAADAEPLAALNADREVMRYFPAPLSRAQSDLMIERIEVGFDRHGFGLWALELRDDGELIGFAGLSSATFVAHFTPAVEVGWRLARRAWGRGYATEAGRAALAFGFERVRLEEIVSFAAVANARSRAVMERLGLTRDEHGDFDHPLLASRGELRRHVLYRLPAERWAGWPRAPVERAPSR
jgi:ribosomal-protein-alanine N-acetyltransferase